MTCHPIKNESGRTIGFCCTTRGPRKRCACGKVATLQCDWKVKERKSGTCDAYICAACTTSPAPDKDLCPTHAEAWRSWTGSRIGQPT